MFFGALLHVFLCVADVVVLLLYPTLLMLEDFEMPLSFFLQMFGIANRFQRQKKIITYSIDKSAKKKSFGQLLYSLLTQSLGFLFLCLLLNN